MDKLKKNGDDTWELFINGQDTFFENFYHIYYKSLCEFGLRLCTDDEFVKDCIQDIFVKIWTNRAELKSIRSIKAYLFTALRNAIINYHASPRSKVSALEDDILPTFILEYSPEEILIGKETDSENLKKVINALNNLTPRQKECIYLKYYTGLEYDEIAKIMGISVKASYKLAARALAILKEWAAKNNTRESKPVYFWFLCLLP